MSKIDVEESIIYMFKDKNDCVSYEWRELMKVDVIDVEESIVYRFDSRDDLVSCVQSLGEQGFFSDDEDFHHHVYGTLSEVKCLLEETKYPFVRRSSNEIKVEYKYFIPADAVVFKEEPKEKKYRPYKDISEFCNETCCEEVGSDVITIRNKINKQEQVLLYVGYSGDTVHLGGYLITFGALCENYEFLMDNEWLPLGVEEND